MEAKHGKQLRAMELKLVAHKSKIEELQAELSVLRTAHYACRGGK